MQEEVTELYKKNKRIFYFFNIFIPLLIGTCIYALFRPDTYIARCFNSLCQTSLSWDFQFVTDYIFLRYFACDMLWAYALYVAIAVFVEKQKLALTGGLSLGLCILVEVMQRIGIFNGTGDIWDVFFEGMAIMIAVVVLAIYERKRNVNEKENI